MIRTLDKKLLWSLLSLFVIFDDVFSYIAIVYWGKHEGHPISRYFVEINPLFYFVFIPITLLSFYAVAKIAGRLAAKAPEKREIYERIILTTILIIWGAGNTSWNFGYLILGRSPFPFEWRTLELIGIGLGLAHAFYMGYKIEQFYCQGGQ